MDAIEKRARELLASCLDEWGHHQEADNVRGGEDLESYELELRLIGQLLRFGFETGSGREAVALTPPEGYVLVPVEPTAEILAAASVAVWPRASRADVQMAIKAANIVLRESMDLAPGMTLEMLAASIATMAPAYRAMLAARPEVP